MLISVPGTQWPALKVTATIINLPWDPWLGLLFYRKGPKLPSEVIWGGNKAKTVM